MVKFVQGTYDKYKALPEKEFDALYFITDAKRIYRGSHPEVPAAATSVEFVTELPTKNILDDILYVVTNERESLFYRYVDGEWMLIGGGGIADSVEDGSIVFTSLNPDMVSSEIVFDEEGNAVVSEVKVITEKAVYDYVEKVKQGIQETFDKVDETLVKHNGAFQSCRVDANEVDTSKIVLVFTDFDNVEHKVDLDKEKFLKDAKLLEDGKTLSLTMTDGSVVNIDLTEIIANSDSVKLTRDIMLTSDAHEMKAGEKLTTGMSMTEVLEALLQKSRDPQKANPSIASFVVTDGEGNTDFEAGTELVAHWNSVFHPGNYSYKSTALKDPITPVSGTGVSVEQWEIFQGSTTGVLIGTEPQGVRQTAMILGDNTVPFTARATYSAGNFALTNLDKLPDVDVKIEKSTSVRTSLITTYRKAFAGGINPDATVTSDIIRALEVGEKAEKGKTIYFNAHKGDEKLVIAIPALISTAEPTFEYFSLAWDNFPGFIRHTTVVEVADARGENNGMVDYVVFTYTPAVAFETETQFRMTIN